MRSVFSRRAVATGLPIAALAASTADTFAAAGKPDAELLSLGEALSVAWARQAAAETLLTPPKSSDACWARFDLVWDEARGIVDKIGALQATTLAGLIVKARACHWCHSGEPIDETFFDSEPTTDRRLAAGILGDLIAMGGADA